MADPNITPPPELVQQWESAFRAIKSSNQSYVEYMLDQAARWGADQELEACCEWLKPNYTGIEYLRAARRPQPQPSLKAQALKTLENMRNGWIADQGEFDLIRRALELVPDDPADDGPVLYSEAMAAEDDDLLAGVTNASEPDINAEEAALIAAPDRPLWVEMRDVYSDPDRIHWSGHGFARELRVVADWLERRWPQGPDMHPCICAAWLRAEADRATNGD